MSKKSFIRRFSKKGTQIARKALLLRNVSIAISAVIVLAFVADFMDGDYINAIAECVGIVLFGIGFFVLYTGNYKRASFCCVGAAFVLMLAMSFVCSSPTKFLLFRNAAYFFLSSSLCALFIENTVIAIVITSINVVAMAIFTFFVLPSIGVPISEGAATLATAELVYILGTFFLIQTTRLSNIYAAEIDTEQKKKNNQVTMLTDVISSSSQTMDSLSQLQSDISDINNLINTSVVSIDKIGEKIASVNNDTSKSMNAVNDINLQLEDLTNMIQAQVSAQKDSSLATTQMVSSIKSVAYTAKQESSTMDNLAVITKEGEEKLMTLLKNINEIQTSIGFIEKVVGMINSISSKTNLLAMNAAIEASHAGVAGKGFAVVSDEIRKLADDTNKKANEIDKQINSIHEVIASVVQDGEKTKAAFGNIQTGIAKSTEAFNEISNSTDELTVGGQRVLDIITSVNTMSQRITDANEQIILAQENVTQISQQVCNSIAELAEDSKAVISINKKVYDSIDPIDKLSQHGAEQATSIKAAINRIIM